MQFLSVTFCSNAEKTGIYTGLFFWKLIKLRTYLPLLYTCIRDVFNLTMGLYLFFCCILFMILGPPNISARGEMIINLNKMVLVPAVISLMLLFLVLDESRLCTTWIYKFIDQKIKWGQLPQTKFKEYDEAYHPYISQWLNLQLVASRTHVVSKLIYFPFFIIVLMLLSRSTYFDNWAFPLALVIIFGTNILITLFCATRLRQAAEKLREATMKNLSHNIIELKSAPGDTKSKGVTSKQKIELIKNLIENVSNVNSGAFRPLKDQYFVRATIIVMGAVGLTITEYLRLAG